MAGLTVLVPIPILDWLLEEFFRRRMSRAIAQQHKQQLSSEVVTELNRGASERGGYLLIYYCPRVSLC